MLDNSSLRAQTYFWSSLHSTWKETILREFLRVSSWFLRAKLWLANNVLRHKNVERLGFADVTFWMERSDDRKYACVRSSGNDFTNGSACMIVPRWSVLNVNMNIFFNQLQPTTSWYGSGSITTISELTLTCSTQVPQITRVWTAAFLRG